MADLYLGLMSGTSVDGIDAALVDLAGTAPRLLLAQNQPYPDAMQRALVDAGQSGTLNTADLCRLDVQVGECFAQAALDVLDKTGVNADQVRAIGSHGQTVCHQPQPPYPCTLQIGDPNIIAERTGITTVADFRRRDLAAGGQGAPLVPAFHNSVFRCEDRNRVVLNIGGIANITVLSRDSTVPVTGFDTGPGNGLMDAWAQHSLGRPMDTHGDWARSGIADNTLLQTLMADPYFARVPPKSTGRDYFHVNWLIQRGAYAMRNLPPQHVQATLCELTALSIAEAIRLYAPSAQEVLVCGGGVHNTYLMERLAQHLVPRVVQSTAQYGLDPDWVEAIAFAWLAKQTLDGNPGNLPSVTGARRSVVLGGIYQKQQ